MPNLRQNVPSELAEELVEVLATGAGTRIERIVSTGHASPPGFWYDQDESEWVVVLQGKARLVIEGATEPRELTPGDWVNIPAHVRHRVEWTTDKEPTVWLAVFYGEQTGSA
jgi:cupin 2 domain-containing protein